MATIVVCETVMADIFYNVPHENVLNSSTHCPQQSRYRLQGDTIFLYDATAVPVHPACKSARGVEGHGRLVGNPDAFRQPPRSPNACRVFSPRKLQRGLALDERLYFRASNIVYRITVSSAMPQTPQSDGVRYKSKS